MTQAFNLSQLANNLNTAGQLDATDGLVNAVPVANGGTGASTDSAARTNLGLVIGTNVPSPTGTGASGTWGINITGNAATATTATTATTAANGGVTSVNGSTGAVTVSIVPTAIAAIGSVLFAANTSTSDFLPGNTIAGSSLYYPTTITSVSTAIYTEGTGVSNPITYLIASGGKYIFGASVRVVSSNSGYSVPAGHTALTGTWRVLTTVVARSSVWDGTDTVSTSPTVMVQRVS